MSLLARFSLANRGLVALIAVVITGVRGVRRAVAEAAAAAVAGVPGRVHRGDLPRRRARDRRVAGHRADREQPPGHPRAGARSPRPPARARPPSRCEYEFGTDLDDVVNKMQTALNRIDAQLPAGGRPAGPRRQHRRPAGRGARRQRRRRTSARWPTSCAQTVVPELEAIDGVRTVEVTGARDAGRGDHPGPGEAGRRAAPADRDRHGAEDQRRRGAGRRGHRRRPSAHRAGRHAASPPSTTCAASCLAPAPGGPPRPARRRRHRRAAARPGHLDHPYQRQAQPGHRGHRHARTATRWRSPTRSATGWPTWRPPPARS